MTETRAEVAQRLVDEGRVFVHNLPTKNKYAQVQDDGRVHTVAIYPDGYFRCGCCNAFALPTTPDLCAHALAVQLAVEKEETECTIKLR